MGELLERIAVWLGVVLLLLVLASVLTGCRTYEAVVETPEEVWVHLELVLLALWCDIVDVIDLLL